MNLESLNQLKAAEKTNYKPAYLKIAGQDQVLYYFLYNPNEYSDSISANYSEVAALSAPVPYLDYNHTSGITRDFSDLLLDTFEDRKSARSIIEGLKNLMIADISKGQFEPPDLEFYWGSESLKPVKLVDFKYRIDTFLGGEPARGVFSLSFKEVATLDPAKITEFGTTPSNSSSTNVSNLVTKNRERLNNVSYPSRINLSDRQIFEGLDLVKTYLFKNRLRYSDNVKRLIQTKNYDLNISIDGKVTLSRKYSSVILQKLGIYNGRYFKPYE